MSYVIGRVYCGHSEFDDDVWQALGNAGQRIGYFNTAGFDHLDLVGPMILAGAAVTPLDEGYGYEVTLPAAMWTNAFVERLNKELETWTEHALLAAGNGR